MLPKPSGPISAFLVAFAWLSIAWPATAQPLERLPKLDSALSARVRLKAAPRQHVIIRVKDGHPAALADLLKPTTNYPQGFLPRLGAVPKDGWQHELRYRVEPDGASYRLWSVGPDGQDQSGSGDDLSPR